MPGFNHRILVVDDEESILATSKTILESQGYEVRIARDGFEALVELRRSLPDLIITDLSMPNMSGFELLSIVRKRFPQIAVIVISAAYSADRGGVIADAFLAKGQFTPEELFQNIARLIAAGPIRASVPTPGRAPVWIPLNADRYFILSCPECLRSFPVPADEASNDLRNAHCLYCNVEVCFLGEAKTPVLKKRRA